MRLGAAMPAAVGVPSRGGNGTFHSFNVGMLHVALVSSEVFFSVQPHSAGLIIEQSEWLEADLKAVDRSVTPFVMLGLQCVELGVGQPLSTQTFHAPPLPFPCSRRRNTKHTPAPPSCPRLFYAHLATFFLCPPQPTMCVRPL